MILWGIYVEIWRGLIFISFEKVIEEILHYEGGYVNHPDDRGGETNMGITKAVARDFGYEGDMKGLDKETAKRIYWERYWKAMSLDEFEDDNLQIIIFDTGVNMGTQTAILKLQKAYNLITGDSIAEDGIVGPETLNAVNGYSGRPQELKFAYIIMRGEKYFNIVRNNSSQRSFIRGWLNRLLNVTSDISSDRDINAKPVEKEEITVDKAVDFLSDKLKEVFK